MLIQYGINRINMWSFLGSLSIEIKRMWKPVKASSKEKDSFHEVQLDKWMAQLPKDIKDQPLSSLAIPGSHDCGSYALTTRYGMAPDKNDIQNSWWFKYFPAVALGITKRWCKTQEVNIHQQLKHGVRYFDMRGAPLVIGKKIYTRDLPLGSEAFASTLDLYFVHGLYGPRIYDMLKSISHFLEKNPGEVVIIHFQHFHSVNKHMLKHLMDQIMSLFGSKVCPYKKSDQCPSLNQLMCQGHQVIVFFPTEIESSFKHAALWPSSLLPNPWANTTSIPVLQSFLQKEQNQRNPDRFFVTQGVLTPDNNYIKRNLPRSLKTSLANQCNKFLVSWLETRRSGVKGPNIVMSDFVEFKNYSIPRKIVLMNYSQ
jgi:hypothetical protein